MNNAKILTLDIETSPYEVFTWGLWEQDVALNQIKQEWSILAYCAKWFDKKEVMYDDTGGRGAKRVRDDSSLLRSLWSLLDTADIVVVQNGASFDIPRINARLVLKGYKPYSPIRVVDTLRAAKKHFGFSSNKLAWMSQYLTDTPKSEHKKFPGFELWQECLKDNPAAWAEMKKYNVRDVVATEKVYKALRPWISGHPNVGVYASGTAPVCPACGGTRLQSRGTSVTQTGLYRRLVCVECGKWSRSKTNMLPKEKKKALLA